MRLAVATCWLSSNTRRASVEAEDDALLSLLEGAVSQAFSTLRWPVPKNLAVLTVAFLRVLGAVRSGPGRLSRARISHHEVGSRVRVGGKCHCQPRFRQPDQWARAKHCVVIPWGREHSLKGCATGSTSLTKSAVSRAIGLVFFPLNRSAFALFG